MKTPIIALLVASGLVLSVALRTGPAQRGPTGVAATIDKLHDAASRADENEYFGLFADDGVFLGTDGGERWNKEQFRAYAKPYFSQGRGWTYLPRPNGRFISISKDGTVAWFDEVLDNAKYGECRGSGVLVRDDSGWKFAQYNLTVPVPNDLLPEVAELIKKKTRPVKAGDAGKDSAK